MKETVLITGAHGLIARHVVRMLEPAYHIKLLTRTPDQPGMYGWDVESGYVDPAALADVDHIVHLAGAKFYGGKTAEETKALSLISRAGAARLLLEKLKENGRTLKSFVSASAAGFYDFKAANDLISEDGPKLQGPAVELFLQWEAAAEEFKIQAVAQRVVILRGSAVLATDGGLLQSFVQAFQADKALLAQQRNDNYMPWLHITDMAAMFAAAVTSDSYDGVYNTAADEPVTTAVLIDKVEALLENKDLTQITSPYHGPRLNPQRIKDAGFAFKYDALDAALTDLIKR